MGLIVQKFGGSSVKDRDHLFRVARIIANTRLAGNNVVAVVSAQGDTTDTLLEKAAEITQEPSAREMDVLLSTGEQISIALLTMTLNALGCDAISLTGWQAGFHTNCAYTKARIQRLDCKRIAGELAQGRVVVVAGFQGMTQLEDITTLVRGGRDTSAVAIAAALQADRCQIFTDVEGIYTADPRRVPSARKLKEVSFDEMLELASMGSQVLNNRSVELAKKYHVELEVLSSLNPVEGTVVREQAKTMEGTCIKGMTKDTAVAVISILHLQDLAAARTRIFSLLAQNDVHVDMICQAADQGESNQLHFSIAAADKVKTMQLLQQCGVCDGGEILVDDSCAKVSVVGIGLQTNGGIAAKLFEALASHQINVKMVTTSEIKISVMIRKNDVDLAMRAIHDALVAE